MEITEIRIKLMDDPSERLQAFCSITLDGCFVIRDLKIIQGTRGSFVAMPSRKLMDRCPRCSCKNHLRARFCNDCGCELHEERASKADDGRAKLYADIAHPINSECRERIQANVIVAYSLELKKAKLPGYVCTYDDFGEENYATSVEEITYTPMVPHSVTTSTATTSTATATSSTATTSRPRHTFVNRVAQLEEEGFGSGLV